MEKRWKVVAKLRKTVETVQSGGEMIASVDGQRLSLERITKKRAQNNGAEHGCGTRQRRRAIESTPLDLNPTDGQDELGPIAIGDRSGERSQRTTQKFRLRLRLEMRLS